MDEITISVKQDLNQLKLSERSFVSPTEQQYEFNNRILIEELSRQLGKEICKEIDKEIMIELREKYGENKVGEFFEFNYRNIGYEILQTNQ